MSGPRRSGTWRERQERDPYVQRPRQQGWRSRAVFKLEQIDRKERLLRSGMLVVNLGAAPGGWSQYVAERLSGEVRIVAVDLLPIEPLASVEIVQGDFFDADVLAEVETALGHRRADLVISDMAPNISGVRAVDQPRAMHLAELALEFCGRALGSGGDFVCKLFQGEGSDAFIAESRRSFDRVRVMKPTASRPASREVYLVARNYRL